jgi:hypothetical protein
VYTVGQWLGGFFNAVAGVSNYAQVSAGGDDHAFGDE